MVKCETKMLRPQPVSDCVALVQSSQLVSDIVYDLLAVGFGDAASAAMVRVSSGR